MKIIFYLDSPTTYQIDLFIELKKFYKIFVIYNHTYSTNHKLKISNYSWMYFLDEKKSPDPLILINKISPKVVIIGGYKMDINLKNKSIKKYFWLERVNNKNHLKSFIRNLYIKLKLKSANGIFAIGKEATKFYRNYNKNVFNIPYSIKKQKKIKFFNKPKFLFVGQLIKRKGIDNIIKTINDLENYNCSFSFVGEGPYKNKIIDLKKKKQNVFYFKFLNKNNLEKIYNKNNILLLPSVYDGWGVVVIEAMARGMTIISSRNVGATSEYIKHNFNGRILEYKKKTLRNEILYFQKNPNKINLFGERNKRLFQNNLCNVKNAVIKIKKILE